ncbi:hypothetical protein [Pseudomonas chlororaphis]|uniref:hypothetical protein n=1 Tax=Pseudomonas chlororaphis TaxID=587753 RepID=UPI000492024C|nr:hypothetical protein [Pseudomonas chlororaphis]
MEKLKALNAAANRYLSRYSKKQFLLAFVLTTALNFLLSYTIPDYTSFYLSSLGGFFFGMMFLKHNTGA